MRRNKKASLPVNSVPPAVRRKAASARESTVAYPSSSSLGSSTSDTSWRCDDPLPLPERKAAPWRAEAARPLDFVHHTALNEHPEPPAQTAAPPPPLPHHHPSSCAESGHRVRGLAFHADNMLNIFHSIPTQMDYKGQKLAEQIFQGIILFSAAVGFVYGYITEQFGWTVYIVMAGFALSCLLTLPPWPIYRRNPLKWLPAQESTTEDKKPTDRKVKRHPKN